MRRTYPNLNRVRDPETHETLRLVYDLIYATRDEVGTAQDKLATTSKTVEELVPEVEDMREPRLFATARGMSSGFFVTDVLDRQVLVVDKQSPTSVLFRQLEVADLGNVFHETPYADGDLLVYDKTRQHWIGKTLGVLDHGTLSGLGDDDHPQYALTNKSRPSPWVAAGDLAGRSIADLGTKDHDLLNGLTDDDHSIYVLLAGRSGGQTVIGGTGSGEDLILRATSHATPGDVKFQNEAATFVMRYSESSGQLYISKDTGDNLLGITTLAASSAGLNLSTDGGQWYVNITGSGDFNVYDADNSKLPFAIIKGAGNNSLYVSANSRVGIGTNNPAGQLSVYTDTSGLYALYVKNDQATAGHGFCLETDGTGSGTIALRVVVGGGDALRIWGDALGTFGGTARPTTPNGATTTTFDVDGRFYATAVNLEKAKASRSTDQVIANDTWEALIMDTQVYDHGGMCPTTGSRFTASVTGWYHVGGTWAWAAHATGLRVLKILRNGVTVSSTSATPGSAWSYTQHVSVDVYMTAGQYVQLFGYQISGGNLNALAGQCLLWIHRFG